MAKSSAFSRREFLRTGVTGGAALVVGFRLSTRVFAGQTTEQEKKTPNPFDAWVSITPNNRVTLILGKSEMGQGIMTALPMILAEELCVDWKNVKVEQAPTNPKIYDLGTGGSGSVAGSWLPLRRAGAAAREMLIAAAAQKWKSVWIPAKLRTARWSTAIRNGICRTVNWWRPPRSCRFRISIRFR